MVQCTYFQQYIHSIFIIYEITLRSVLSKTSELNLVTIVREPTAACLQVKTAVVLCTCGRKSSGPTSRRRRRGSESSPTADGNQISSVINLGFCQKLNVRLKSTKLLFIGEALKPVLGISLFPLCNGNLHESTAKSKVPYNDSINLWPITAMTSQFLIALPILFI